MAKPILVANWKNYPSSVREAREILKGYGRKKDLYKKVILFVAPPTVYLETASSRLRSFGNLAAQNLSSQEKGAHTGEITPEILKGLGVRLVILGHSEQRALGESALSVAEKVRVALKAGFIPLICFGESRRDAEGEHFESLREELKTLLSTIKKNELGKVVLAYEPIWAVGSKSLGAIEPTELSQTILFIKKVISDLFGRKVAEGVAILYGGSVDEVNAGILVRNSGIRGFLVGRASLEPKKLEGIAASIV